MACTLPACSGVLATPATAAMIPAPASTAPTTSRADAERMPPVGPHEERRGDEQHGHGDKPKATLVSILADGNAPPGHGRGQQPGHRALGLLLEQPGHPELDEEEQEEHRHARR